MTARPGTSSAACPRCGSDEAIPIVYGLPAGPQVFRAAERGEAELGGCCITDGLPTRRCKRCGHGFDPIELAA